APLLRATRLAAALLRAGTAGAYLGSASALRLAAVFPAGELRPDDEEVRSTLEQAIRTAAPVLRTCRVAEQAGSRMPRSAPHTALHLAVPIVMAGRSDLRPVGGLVVSDVDREPWSEQEIRNVQ